MSERNVGDSSKAARSEVVEKTGDESESAGLRESTRALLESDKPFYLEIAKRLAISAYESLTEHDGLVFDREYFCGYIEGVIEGGIEEVLVALAAPAISRPPTQGSLDTPRDERLNANTRKLIEDFSAALIEKLAVAEKKYGYSDHWMQNDWMDECRVKLRNHLEKGDPRDVAAYCAFLWYHKESTSGDICRLPDDSDAAFYQWFTGNFVPDISNSQHLQEAWKAALAWRTNALAEGQQSSELVEKTPSASPGENK